MAVNADLRQVFYALSDALDLVGVDDVAHGKRVAAMAAECAKALAWPQSAVLDMFDLGLIHDIGVSSTAVHQHLVNEFDWEGSQEHAELGYRLLKDFRPMAALALPIRYHHTRWDVMQNKGMDDLTARKANLILLVDRVDAMAAPYYAGGKILGHRNAIRDEIRTRAGSYFCPELVEAFLKISAHEAFWLLLEPRALDAYLDDMRATGQPYQADRQELRQLAEIFATIVDAKSSFTVTHSHGVANVAVHLAAHLGVSSENRDKLEIAGLLHDLGKLRIPDEILDKPGRLDEEERLVMNTHSFETLQILRNIDGFEEIGAWAASHHEAPGGAGYPYGLDGETLPLEARILRVADIFQAMVQDRPYRKGLDREAVDLFMRKLQQQGSIDAEIGDVLHQNLDEMMAAARLEDSALPMN